MTITEFLEARIDDDEARAGSGWSRLGDTRWETDNYGRNFLTPSAVLAECAAKRAIIALCQPEDAKEESWGPEAYMAGSYDDCIRALAAVYASHPDYEQEWAA